MSNSNVMSRSKKRPRFSRGAFTLVELLVVIGIIGVLMSILIPTTKRIREQAKTMACISNMRQLAVATLMYANQYNGRFPRPAVEQQPEDWFHWHPGRTTIQRGGIAQFLGYPLDLSLFRCPSDDVENHWWATTTNYKYSYSVNFNVCVLTWHPYLPGPSPKPQLTLSQVKRPASVILLIDESAETADDGCWAWQWDDGGGRNVLANRHDRSRESYTDRNAGKGAVAFVDGHAELVPRAFTYDEERYDPYYPDPTSPLRPYYR